jgi:hypothetical protein
VACDYDDHGPWYSARLAFLHDPDLVVQDDAVPTPHAWILASAYQSVRGIVCLCTTRSEVPRGVHRVQVPCLVAYTLPRGLGPAIVEWVDAQPRARPRWGTCDTRRVRDYCHEHGVEILTLSPSLFDTGALPSLIGHEPARAAWVEP